MNIEQKLAAFLENTMAKVEAERLQTTHHIHETVQTACYEAKRSARREMQQQLAAEAYALQREANQKIAAAHQAARLAKAALRQQQRAALRADVEADLRAFVAGPAYADFLRAAQSKAQADDFFRHVQVMARDVPLWDGAEGVAEDFIGGFRLLSENRLAMADHTLLARLEAATCL